MTWPSARPSNAERERILAEPFVVAPATATREEAGGPYPHHPACVRGSTVTEFEYGAAPVQPSCVVGFRRTRSSARRVTRYRSRVRAR